MKYKEEFKKDFDYGLKSRDFIQEEIDWYLKNKMINLEEWINLKIWAFVYMADNYILA